MSPGDSNAAPNVAVDEYGKVIVITREGAAASYVRGQWHPGISFEARDVMNLSVILDAGTVGNVLAQADAALKASLEPGGAR
jgi:hypothetical protein